MEQNYTGIITPVSFSSGNFIRNFPGRKY